jgi:glutamyl-tRNA reductase
VDEHVGKFLTWQASVEIISVVEALRHKLKSERAEFVRQRAERVTGLSPEQREQVESLIDDLLEKMLLDPARRLQGEKDLRRKIQQVEAIRDLFLPDRER